MKRLILLVAACAVGRLCTFAQDAGTHVAVHAGETPIEQLLTDEQKSSVTHLAVTGKLLDADYRFIRENLLEQLKELNLRDTDIDTIPAHALHRTGSYKHFECAMKVVLPQMLKHLADSCMYSDCNAFTIELTGNFPSFGKGCFFRVGWYASDTTEITPVFVLSEDNTHCTDIPHSGIYSSDGYTLYYACNDSKFIKDGTKVIAGYAFAGHYIQERITIPETVDSIGDYALHDIWFDITTNGVGGIDIYNHAVTPQKLGREALGHLSQRHSYCLLFVPDDSYELYRRADGWKDFDRRIYKLSQEGIDCVRDTDGDSDISFDRSSGRCMLTSRRQIRTVQVSTLSGCDLWTCKANGEYMVALPDNHSDELTLVRVEFTDGTTKTIKKQKVR